jgi:multidrug efflux system membrane fusion protein
MCAQRKRSSLLCSLVLYSVVALLSAPQPARADLTVSYINVTAETEFSTKRVYAGMTIAARKAELGFKRGGEVAAINVDLGDTVEAGQLLAKLDTRGIGSSSLSVGTGFCASESSCRASGHRAGRQHRTPC